MFRRMSMILTLLAMLTVGYATTAYAANGVTAWSGNDCSPTKDGSPHCTNWQLANGNSTCQAHAPCSDGNGCMTWFAEIDLPDALVVSWTYDPIGPQPPDPIARTFSIISEETMTKRLRPDLVRYTFSG